MTTMRWEETSNDIMQINYFAKLIKHSNGPQKIEELENYFAIPLYFIFPFYFLLIVTFSWRGN